MANKTLTIAIGILILTAMGLGYAIYKQKSGSSSDVLSENRFDNLKQGEIQATSKNQRDEGNGSTTVNLLPSAEELGISEDERAVLDHPVKDASEVDKQRHLDLVQKLAKEAPILDITTCSVSSPVVFKAKYGEEISVKNDDDSAHTILFDAENTVYIPANSTMNVTPNFQHGPGTYGYGCDQTPHAVGFFLVTP